MKTYQILITLLFLFPAITLAQGKYIPGYIVNAKGDTVKGTISYKKWTNNPSGFDFKSDNGNIIHCNFDNTSTLCINARVTYKRFITWVSQDRYVDLNFIPGSDNTIGVDSTKKLDTVFLKVVTAGKNLTLYTYTDFTKQRFFIGEKDMPPTELILHKYLEQEPVLTAVDDRKYRIQLQVLRTVYASKNPGLINDIQLADYKESDLAAIVKKLNSN